MKETVGDITIINAVQGFYSQRSGFSVKFIYNKPSSGKKGIEETDKTVKAISLYRAAQDAYIADSSDENTTSLCHLRNDLPNFFGPF